MSASVLYLPMGAIVYRAQILRGGEEPVNITFDPPVTITKTGRYVLGYNEDGKPCLTSLDEPESYPTT